MKRKNLVIFAAVLVAAAAVFLWLKHRSGGEPGEDGDEGATVVRVQTGELKRMTLHGYVEGYGTVEAAPASHGSAGASIRLSPGVAGMVAACRVAEGDRVSAGETLIDLDDRAARAAVQRAQRADAAAQAALARQRELLREQNSSVKAVQDAAAQAAAAASDLAAAQVQLAWTHVVSPIAGTVVRLNARSGEMVDTATVVAEVTDLTRLVVSADIPASEAAGLADGQELEVTSPGGIQGAVDYVGAVVDPALGTVSVRAPLPADAGLRPGQFVPLRIVTATHADALAAPQASVVTDEDGRSVIALVAGNEATQTPVQTGLREGGWVEVSGAGLKAGDTVVTTGAYGLPAKTRIEVER
jgi:RND family efflux transporter MFP subunit